MNDEDIEQEIQAKGKTAPRITPADIESNIASEHVFSALDGVMGDLGTLAATAMPTDYPDGLRMITFCVLILKNGHRIVGVNEGPVSAANFDLELGIKMARKKAIDQVWPLLGFRLRDRLSANPAAIVINNNQPGTEHIVQAPPYTTLDVGTELFTHP